jgi:Xaa-Pro aminopeptidase
MAPGQRGRDFLLRRKCRAAPTVNIPYRQNSDFWYLTGFNEPGAVLILVKSDENAQPQRAVQPGARPDGGNLVWPSPWARRGSGEAGRGPKHCRSSDINEQLHLLLNGLDVVYHGQGEYAYADEIL